MEVDREKLILKMTENLFSIEELSIVSKVSRNSISRIKNGKTTEVRLTTIGKLAQALKCEVKDLVKES